MLKKLWLLAGVSAVALSLGGGAAVAEELDITQIPRPDYDPTGLRMGSFRVLPKMIVGVEYNDNIYATENNTDEDFITRVIPSVAVNSDWNNHALNLDAFLDSGFYADYTSEDFTDYGIGGDGRIDIQRNANLFGGASAAHLHDERGDPDDTKGNEPTVFDRYEANAGGFYKPNRLGLLAEGAWTRLDYEDSDTSLGTFVNNDDRDRDVYTERLRVGYDVQPGYTAFVQGSLNQREYDIIPDDNGFDRDSDGWRMDAGMEFSITGTVEGEVYGGYFSQSYDDPRFSDVDDVDFGGRVLWSITPLTSLKSGLVRDVVETTSINASSYVATVFDVRVDHELMRNVLVGGAFSFQNNDYDGIPLDDDIWRLKADAKYLFNRNFFAGANIGWTDRDSNTANNSYDQFVAGVSVGAQF